MPSIKLNDAEIAYTDRGQGPAELFIQGVGLAGSAWSPQTTELSRDHRCISFDNRGVGDSRGDTRTLSVECMARDALALLDSLKLTRAHVVGHSLGGVIAQRLALIAPERIASLRFERPSRSHRYARGKCRTGCGSQGASSRMGRGLARRAHPVRN